MINWMNTFTGTEQIIAVIAYLGIGFLFFMAMTLFSYIDSGGKENCSDPTIIIAWIIVVPILAIPLALVLIMMFSDWLFNKIKTRRQNKNLKIEECK